MKRITFFIFSILCFTACDNEIIDKPDDSGNNNPKTGSQIELRMPDAEKVNVYSTATKYECTIDNLWVLLFKADNETLDTLEFINVSNIVNNGLASQLLPQLSFTPENGRKIVCIANTDITTNTPPTGITYSNINDKFTLMANNYYYGNDASRLPMYGEFEWSPLSGYTCIMTRAVAKIQVQMGTSVSDITGTFTAENVSYTLHDGARGGHIQPQVTIQGIANNNSVVTVENYYLLQKEGAKENETNIFLYEYPSSTRTGVSSASNNVGDLVSESEFHPNRQHIILAKNNGLNTTFYRLDFYDSTTGKFFDTKRNHHYTFTINKVRSEGYSTSGQARNNPGSNIEYTILVEDGSSSITSNGQYAIVTSADTAFLDNRAYSSENVATARVQLPSDMPSLTATTNNIEVKAYPASTFTLNASDGSYPPALSSLTTSDSNINITTTTNFQIASLVFTVGNITHKLIIVNKAEWDGINQPI